MVRRGICIIGAERLAYWLNRIETDLEGSDKEDVREQHVTPSLSRMIKIQSIANTD